MFQKNMYPKIYKSDEIKVINLLQTDLIASQKHSK